VSSRFPLHRADENLKEKNGLIGEWGGVHVKLD
jgi:hypothetical protein